MCVTFESTVKSCAHGHMERRARGRFSGLFIHGNTKSDLFNRVRLGSSIRALSFDYEKERSGMSK